MRFVFYTHSLVSDWNHGNAHFLRGVMRELLALGHEAVALEPEDGWSRSNLLDQHGAAAVAAFHDAFPGLNARTYGAAFDHDAALDGADVVVVHEWTDPALIARIGQLRARGAGFRLLFHDTHHRAVSRMTEIGALDLSGYDAVLAFGEALREKYLAAGWGREVFTWHEAADVALFHPMPEVAPGGELIWIGNWGDGERAAELEEFLIAPAEALGLAATIHGVRYPQDALDRLAGAGIAYRGWLPNAAVPAAFARHTMTVHVPRQPYRHELPGIPTIRPFEALACGIPLISAPWDDVEGLFRKGDYLTARDGAEMESHMWMLRNDPAARAEIAARGLQTIRARHTCRHRVEELLEILARLDTPAKRRTA